MGPCRYPSDPLGDYLQGGSAAKGGSVRTILYVSGTLITLTLVVVTGWAVIH